MIPSTIQKVARVLKDEVMKDFRYTYYLEVSSCLYMSPYLFQADPQIGDFLACFDDGKLLASSDQVENIARDLGLVLLPQGGLSKINFFPSLFKTILLKAKIDEYPAPYFIMTKDSRVSPNGNSLTKDWFAFPLKSVFSSNPHKAIIRRMPC